MLRFHPVMGTWKNIFCEATKPDYLERIAETTWFGRSIKIITYYRESNTHDFERSLNRNSVINYLNRNSLPNETPLRRGWLGGWLGGDSQRVIQERYTAVVLRLQTQS